MAAVGWYLVIVSGAKPVSEARTGLDCVASWWALTLVRRRTPSSCPRWCSMVCRAALGMSWCRSCRVRSDL